MGLYVSVLLRVKRGAFNFATAPYKIQNERLNSAKKLRKQSRRDCSYPLHLFNPQHSPIRHTEKKYAYC